MKECFWGWESSPKDPNGDGEKMVGIPLPYTPGQFRVIRIVKEDKYKQDNLYQQFAGHSKDIYWVIL